MAVSIDAAEALGVAGDDPGSDAFRVLPDQHLDGDPTDPRRERRSLQLRPHTGCHPPRCARQDLGDRADQPADHPQHLPGHGIRPHHPDRRRDGGGRGARP
ncbi:hypothetical protein [Pseudonocardia sp. TRM90224]|uniref:hypothetical protein n=1 Tax=Pseudonocardia sp. TRM90224 TaxID=2812678 RepID=UPI001E3B12C7|nr:hypothetical protein [Pseudonocardia sp. TRM90224]